MKMKKVALLLVLGVLSVLLGGCMMKSVAELYALPEQSPEYNSLQNALSQVVTGSTEYSSPMNGANRQPIQLADLNGDGINEAIVFLSTSGENPLKTCIFTQKDGRFVNTCVIEGSGSAFDRVEYAQLDGLGGNELIIGRRIGNQTAQSIGVYSIVDGGAKEMMSATYSEFTITDLDGDGNRDLFLLRFNAETREGTAELYRCREGMLGRETQQKTTVSQSGLRQMNVGMLSQTYRGVFVSGVLEDGSAATDVYTFHEDVFTHVSSTDYLELQTPPVRGYDVFATDVDGDGYIEFPQVIRLQSGTEDKPDSVQSLISWHNYDPENGLSLKETTYHNFAGGWFLRIPKRIGAELLIGRGGELAGTPGLSFALSSGTSDELFCVYMLTGSARDALTSEEDCFILSRRGDATFAARLGVCAQQLNLTREEMEAMFGLIQVKWNSGET